MFVCSSIPERGMSVICKHIVHVFSRIKAFIQLIMKVLALTDCLLH